MRTSQTHPLMIDGFDLGAGVVGMTLCPGRKGPSYFGDVWYRDLEADIEKLRDWGATVVITLTEQDEMERLGVGGLGATVSEGGMTWLHLPIPDTGEPEANWSERWKEVSPEIHAELERGGRIVIHCKAGLERTALIAALVQCEYGRDLDTALNVIAAARSGAGPLLHQRSWLETYLAEAGYPSDAAKLDAFLLNHPAIARHTAEWAGGTIRLSISTHPVEDGTAPSAFTTSARCIVLAKDSVLVMKNPDSRHILPGGRLEFGEDSRMAVVREVREETGLHIMHLSSLALMVYRHLTPRPERYPYPYPVFTQDIYVTRLSVPVPIVANDDHEQGGEFLPIAQALDLIPENERDLLRAALAVG